MTNFTRHSATSIARTFIVACLGIDLGIGALEASAQERYQERSTTPAFQDSRRLPQTPTAASAQQLESDAESRRRAESLKQQQAAAEDAERQRTAEAEARQRAEEERQRLAAATEAKRKADDALRTQTQATPVAAALSRGGASNASGLDGTYSTHVRSACGEPFQAVILRIAGGAISFEHVFQSVPYGWRGNIDADGNIKLSVGSGTAFLGTGRFSDQRIELNYPQCGRTPIIMQVRWRTN